MNLSLASCCKRCCAFLDSTKPGQEGLDISKESFSGFSQICFAALDFEKGYFEMLLQPRNGIADGRLRSIHPCGSGAEAPQFDNSFQHFPLVDGRIHEMGLLQAFRRGFLKKS